jgi:hypothetical protein
MLRRLAASLGGAALALLSDYAVAQPMNLKPPSTANMAQICTNAYLDNTKILGWYYFNDADVAKNFDSPAALQKSFSSPATEQGAKRSVLDAIEADVEALISVTSSGFKANTTVEAVNLDAFFAGQAPTLKITCGAQAAASSSAAAASGGTVPAKGNTGASWGTDIRVRGSSDGLVAAASSSAFTSATGASLSFSENGQTKTTSNVLQAAVGVDFHFPAVTEDQHWPPASDALIDIIPFAAVNRNISVTSGKVSSSSIENVDAGAVFGISSPFAYGGGHVGANVLTGTFEHIWNDIDDSQLQYVHFVDQPVLNGYLNDYFFVPALTPIDKTWFAASVLLDGRGDFGYFSNRGSDPLNNADYEQVGTDFGIAVSLVPIQSDISVTETYLTQLERQRPTISYFQVAWTYPIFGKNLGLTASYQDGRLETTAQKVQQWLISLSAKY